MNNLDEKKNIQKSERSSENQLRSLPDVFKELEKSRDAQIRQQLEEKNGKKTHNKKSVGKKLKEKNKSIPKQKINVIEIFKGRDPLSIAMLTVVALLGITMFSSNYIFAKEDESNNENKKKEIIGTFEKNENIINIQQILIDNINTTESKELLTTQRNIDFETEYVENSKLQKDEQKVSREGVQGIEEVSFIRTSTNSEIVNDTIIGIKTIQEPTTQIIDVGTNEYLAEQKIHIGDSLYAKENASLYKEMNTSSELIGIILKYYDVRLLDIEGDWCKVQIFDYVGYAEKKYFVSANIEPDIVEKNRKQKIIVNVNEDMSMNQKSGLTLDDYKKIFSNNSRDTYKIFEQNAENFYNAEQKYNVNGLFVAAIGVHESAWGTSTISRNKNNLFGYGAYDSDPYNSSVNFDGYASGINTVAKMLSKYYLNPAGTSISDDDVAVGSFYNGSTAKGVNVRYASDPDWATKVYNTMKSLYDKIAP